MVSASPRWDPNVHMDRRPFLVARNRVKATLARYFEEREFLEVETAALQVSPGNEAHLHGFQTELVQPSGECSKLYLHTSPEFACKKLLAAGERRIFTFAHVFRNRERGVLHHPEFTLLEWYRANESYDAVIEDCFALVALAADVSGAREFTFRGRVCDPDAPPERISVAQAFEKFAAIDLLATVSADNADRDALARQAVAANIKIAADDTWSDIFSRILVERVEPNLGIGRPTVLDEYPAVEAALARRKKSDPRVAERFEIYVCGVELANGFGELTDPIEQRRRFETEMAEMDRVYGKRYPFDEDFLTALAKMPPASGCALGFDRLVMLATHANRIEQVIWTPVVESGT